MAELRHYRYFVEIARRGTFTAASEALNMTQSALSEQILQLERECGSQLFNRRHSGITLTPAGEYLLHQAEVLLAKAAETREGLAGFRHGYQDRLRIASVLGPIQSWLPAALADFVQVHPHVQLQVNHHHGVNEILARLAGDQLDIGVVSLLPSCPAPRAVADRAVGRGPGGARAGRPLAGSARLRPPGGSAGFSPHHLPRRLQRPPDHRRLVSTCGVRSDRGC